MSPLRWFRRHATWMLIIFGVVLMAIFGLGPVFDQMARGFQDSANTIDDPVIVSYREGEITRSKFDSLQRNHYASQRFLRALQEQAVAQCKEREIQYQALASVPSPLQRTDNQEFVDEQMLNRKLLAERAAEEGVVISDGTIDDYLKYLAGGAEFSRRDWKQINKVVNERIPLTVIRNHLALELKAMQMQRFTNIGIPLNPIPTEAVELYAQANSRIECEVVPVSVEEYVSKVSGEPSQAEMKALFEEGKHNYSDAAKKEPGFKVPRKVNVQYFAAEMATFLENEKAKLTDAQIQAEYDKLVEAEDPIVVEVIPDADPEGFNLDFGDENSDEKTGAEDGEKKDSVENLDVDADVPVLDMPETTTEEPSVPDPSELINEKPVEAESGLKVTPAEKKSGGSDQSLMVRGTKDQFASFTQDEDEEEKKVEAATEKTGSETDSKADQEKMEETQSDSEVGGIADLELSDESAGPQTAEKSAETRVKPLTEVADEIRSRLARAEAFKKKDEAIRRAQIAMENYQTEVLRWDTSRDKDSKPKPEAPDFESIAKANGLVFRETGLVDPFELRETQIGKVNFPVQVQSPQGPVRMDFQSVSNKIFIDFDRIEELIPQAVNDILTGDAYVFWMSEKEDVRIPGFDESVAKIKEFWTYQQAVELARDAAASMADKAKSSGEKLTVLYPEKAAPTGEFTWFRPGRGAQAIYGMPFGIENPGDEFMQEAFELGENEIGVAANEPRDTVYVIQKTSTSTSVADLGQEYLDKQYFRFKRVPTDVMGAAMHYARDLDFGWNQEFNDSMGVNRMR